MSLSKDLIGINMVAEQALRLGFNNGVIAGVGTAQSGGAAIPKSVNYVTATTESGQTAFVLPSAGELMMPYFIFNSSSTTALIYPPTSGAINAVSANSSVSITTLLARVFWRISTNQWVSFVAA